MVPVYAVQMSNVQYPISNFAIGYSTLDIYICPMNWLASPETWIALLTLTVLEIVLGIDNIIFHLDPGR